MTWLLSAVGFIVGFAIARSFTQGVDERLRRASAALEARLPQSPLTAAPPPRPRPAMRSRRRLWRRR